MALDIEKLEDSPHLLDLLLQMEDILDSLDLYVFKNWFAGELIDGPRVRRYWLDITLKYDYYKMPDPRGGKRLLKHDIQVSYAKVPNNTSTEEKQDGSDEPKDDDCHWEIYISIPRRLVGNFSNAELDFYDEEVDIDDVQDAHDSGMNDETGYDQEEEQEAVEDAEENNEFNDD